MPPSKHKKKKQRTEIVKDSVIKLSFRGKKNSFFFFAMEQTRAGAQKNTRLLQVRSTKVKISVKGGILIQSIRVT